MDKFDREYAEGLAKELDDIIEEIKDKSFRSDLEKQRQVREQNRRFIEGRFVKREFNLVAKMIEEFKAKVAEMSDENFSAKDKLKENVDEVSEEAAGVESEEKEEE